MKPVAIVHDRTIARLPDRINKVRFLFLILSCLTSSVVAVVVHRKVTGRDNDDEV